MIKLIKHFPHLIRLSVQEWSEDHASRLAAAVAYYTIFSLAPLLVVVIAVTGLLWSQDIVRTQILHQIQALVGAQGATFVGNLVNNRGSFGQGIVATIIGVITLILGALGVFSELQSSLDTIWDVQLKKTKGLIQGIERSVIDRLISFSMVIGLGFLLLVSLVLSTAVTAVQGVLASVLPFSQLAIQLTNQAFSLVVITVLFALMFKYLPNAKIAWRDVWLGAFITAILFEIGKALIGLYLGNSNVASSYGAAGSLIILLLWIYYSAQIVFFGAEFTQVYANHYGSKVLPDENAVSTKTAGPATTPQERAAQRRQQSQPAPARTVPLPVTGQQAAPARVEAENRKTVRILAGITLGSFLSGVVAALFGLKKR